MWQAAVTVNRTDWNRIADADQITQVNQRVDARNITFFGQSAQESFGGAAIPGRIDAKTAEGFVRHAANDSISLKGVLPMRSNVARCSAK
jgi:hypothetical protein